MNGTSFWNRAVKMCPPICANVARSEPFQSFMPAVQKVNEALLGVLKGWTEDYLNGKRVSFPSQTEIDSWCTFGYTNHTIWTGGACLHLSRRGFCCAHLEFAHSPIPSVYIFSYNWNWYQYFYSSSSTSSYYNAPSTKTSNSANIAQVLFSSFSQL